MLFKNREQIDTAALHYKIDVFQYLCYDKKQSKV